MPSLPVSHILQRRPGECLAACAAMALNFLNVAHNYDDLVGQLKIIPRIGGAFSNLRFLQSQGIKVLVEHGELETLRNALELALPPIVLVDTAHLPYWDEATAHAVVIVGLEGDQILLNDPAFRDAPKIIRASEFELAWIDLDQFYALIQLG